MLGPNLYRTGISGTKAVFNEIVEIGIFLSHKALLGQLSISYEVEHGANARCGGDLDGATAFAANVAGVNFVSVTFLHEAAIFFARHIDKNQNHILHRNRQGVLKNVFHQVFALI